MDMTIATVEPMAKKKPGRPRKHAVDAAKDAADRSPMIVQMRGSEEFKEYVHRGAEFDRNTVAKMTENAIIHYLKSIGFDERPPKR